MNSAYPLFPVAIIVFLAYFTTRVFAYWEVFSLKWHRRFWNYLLMLSFLVSGLLGLLSVVKVNYKLEIPHYDTYLQWHVAFGISMVLVAFFHLSWHLKYYFSFCRSRARAEAKDDLKAQFPEFTPESQRAFRMLLFLLGLVAIISQVVFIREFIKVLSGNELVVGIVLSAWMLLSGWGALSGRSADFNGFTLKKGIRMLTALALFPLLLITLLYLLKYLMLPPGTQVNMLQTLLAAFVLLFPVCFLSGYLFTAFSTVYSMTKDSMMTGKSYALESLGSLAGGVLFSIILGRVFHSFQLFGVTAASVLLAGAWMMRKEDRPSSRILIFAGLCIPLLIFVFNPDRFVKKLSFPNQELVSDLNTRYGNLVLTRQADQVNVYENNSLLFYSDNVIMSEEAVHFAMVQHRAPGKVLLISGGMAGMTKEILKYGVDRITYLESNPGIFRLSDEDAGFLSGDKRVEVIKKDIRYFLGKTVQVYDVILINLPPPSSLGLNRFYTEEFFHLLKKHCNTETVVCTGLPSTANYAEESALDANASLWLTLGRCFGHVLLMPGERNYFLASDSPLSSVITEKIAGMGIQTEYVNRDYLDDRLLEMRSEMLVSGFSDSVSVNRDFYPFMYVKQISHWLSHFGTPYRLLVIIPAVLFLLFFFRTDRVTAGLYTGGFTAASLEVTLLLAYQVFFGSIYLSTALFFAVFMAGLAFGSSLKYSSGTPVIKRYYQLQFMLALFALILPFMVQLFGHITEWVLVARFLFYVLIFVLAAGIGFEFLMASKLRQKSYSDTSGVNYSTDLLGSAFGAFLTAIVLLPLIGLVWTCMVVAFLNLVSGVLAFSAKNKLIWIKGNL